MSPYRIVTLTKRFLNAASLARSLYDRGHDRELQEAIFLVDGGQENFGLFLRLSRDWPVCPCFIMGPTGPFNFARSANFAIREYVGEGQDILLVNDDTVLLTPFGCDILWSTSIKDLVPRPALIVPAVNGLTSARNKHRDEEFYVGQDQTWPFIWAYIPAQAWREVGPLDERFVGYGWEDEDWQRRAYAAGWISVKTPEVRVEHLPPDASTFRSQAGWQDLELQNRLLFEEKWKGDQTK